MKNLPKVIVVDANFIIAFCSPTTQQDDRARIEDFIERVEKAKSKVVFPMVAVAEFLVGAELAGIEFLNTLEKKSCIYMADFNKAAAYELAQIDRAAIGAGDKKDESEENWQKIKIDRQVVATGIRLTEAQARVFAVLWEHRHQAQSAEFLMRQAGLSSEKPMDVFKLKTSNRGDLKYEGPLHAYEKLVIRQQRHGLYRLKL